jgi:hypothetical protein
MSTSVFFSSASELATITNTFSVGGVGTNPTTVTVTITSPTGVVTTPAATSLGSGAYTVDVTCDEDGEWQYEWVGTGAAVDTAVGTWFVNEIDLGKLYCPIATIKSRLNITHNNSDAELHAACFAVSRWVEGYTERLFWRTDTAVARTFEPTSSGCLELPEYCDLVSITSVKTDTAGDGTFATTWSASDYQLLPYNPDAAPERRPYTDLKAVGSQSFPLGGRRRNSVQITGVWGWPKVPYGIRQGTAILVADTFKLKDTAFGIEGGADFSTSLGENRRAMKFIDQYRRNGVLVA